LAEAGQAGRVRERLVQLRDAEEVPALVQKDLLGAANWAGRAHFVGVTEGMAGAPEAVAVLAAAEVRRDLSAEDLYLDSAGQAD
jgi:hypothetical protein